MPEQIAPDPAEVKELPLPIEPADPAAAEDADQDEWDKVQEEIFPEAPGKKEEAKPEDRPEDPAAVAEPEPDSTAQVELRMAQRRSTEEFEAVRNDIKAVLLSDVPTELKDADGEAIKGPEDLLKLLDPLTLPGQPGFDPEHPQGSAFTPDRASITYLQMKQELNEAISKNDQYADQLARVNVQIKDESDTITKKYADVFKANPKLAEQVWASYSKTLTVAADGKVITAAPVSLLDFYTTVLEPYARMAKAEADAAAIKEESDRIAKAQRRSDRSDIYGGGKIDDMDEEDKEWAEAKKEVYKNR